MAGRIADDDIARVREASPIDSVVGEYVQLRGGSGGDLSGLCPFHDEKSPSFHVTPARGLFYCFGCGAGGDTIGFVERIEHLSFAEAVEKLARRAGIELRYEQAGPGARAAVGQRARLVAAHRVAIAFFAEQLHTEAAKAARAFLTERGFDEAAAAAYGVGYAPDSWDALTRHLAGQGFSREELQAAGLTSQGQRGAVDRFRNRLMFPILDQTGDPVGFGARKLAEADNGPKYLNTPETPIYKKSHLLYGLDKARAEIGRRSQAVVVEGYTDVMACHLAGVTTAVATCGTSLTSDHVNLLRRLLMDQTELRGEVVFTFDGDAAGQKAALRAFTEDARFVTQTFVAVDPDGRDPCELRLAKGDAAVRDLVARRIPLFEFKIRSELARYDLESAEGRVRALDATAPVVAGIKDRALKPEYARRLAGWLGMEVDDVLRRVAEAAGPHAATVTRARPDRAAADDATVALEREALKAVLQVPSVAASLDLDDSLFALPAHQRVWAAVVAAGGPPPGGDPAAYLARVRDAAGDDEVRGLVTALAVEAPRSSEPGGDPVYAAAVLARLREIGLNRRVVELKSRLQRLNPTEESAYNKLFAELIELEARARALREQALGIPAGNL